MSNTTTSKPRRFQPNEVIISELTKDDLQEIAEGYYASFPIPWFDEIEPSHLRPSDTSLRAKRFATRMLPWLSEPHTRWTKATLHPSSPDYDQTNPNKIIGHAGWLLPGRTNHEIMNFWRRDASDVLGWREKMGWSLEFEDELWSGTDLGNYQGEKFVAWDEVRGEYLGGRGHWHLAPLWVLPEYQDRSVASFLIKNAIDLADKEEPPAPMYLEAMQAARPIYEHLGFRGVKGRGEGFVMIRNAPGNFGLLGIESNNSSQ